MISKFNLLFEQVMHSLLLESGKGAQKAAELLGVELVSIERKNIKPTFDDFFARILSPAGIRREDYTTEIGSVGKKDVSR